MSIHNEWRDKGENKVKLTKEQILKRIDDHLVSSEELALAITKKIEENKIISKEEGLLETKEDEDAVINEGIDKEYNKFITENSHKNDNYSWIGNKKTKMAKGIEQLIDKRRDKNRFIMKALAQMVDGIFVKDVLSSRRGKIYRYRQHSPINSQELKGELAKNKHLSVEIKTGTMDLFVWLLGQLDDVDEHIKDYYDYDDEFINLPLPKRLHIINNGDSNMDIIRIDKIGLTYGKSIVFASNDNLDNVGKDWSNEEWFKLLVLKHQNEIRDLIKSYEQKIKDEYAVCEKGIEEVKEKAAKLLVVAQLNDEEK